MNEVSTTCPGDYLILVRHGATEWNESRRLNGTTDVPLSVKGLRQVRDLGRQLAACRLDAVIFSSRLRSKQTADAVLKHQGEQRIQVTSDRRLDEVDFGALEGALVSDLRQPSLELPGALLGRVRAALPRVEHVWEELRERKGVSLVVSHGYLIRAMVCHCVLQAPLEKLQRIELSSCGVTIVNWQNCQPRLMCLNGAGEDTIRHVAANR